MSAYEFTSESVCAGHPDKICDQISDAVVDAVLAQDPNGHVAVETMVGFNHVYMVGEVTANAQVNYRRIARAQISRLGYTDPLLNFTNRSPITVRIHEQSPEIAVGVQPKGAGDQGMMFGYACNETPQLMPLPIALAHELARKIDQVREQKGLPYLRPDGKTQVTVAYEDGRPVAVTHVVVAVPHSEEVDLKTVKADIFRTVVQPVLAAYGFKISPKQLIVNGTGVWHMSGPAADSGLTGRKIVVDTYGGYARVGGGAFSGKDPTKVDRSGAYAARFIAKNIVAHHLADRAEVNLSFFIGAQRPLMQEIDTFGTAKVAAKTIADYAEKILDTSVANILDTLQLRRPVYLPTAAYGHFGREEFSWEKIVD
jgi:S-adenosylmethionine synthetase